MRVKHELYGEGEGIIYENTSGLDIKVEFDCGEVIKFDYNFSFTKGILKLVNPNDKLPFPLKPLNTTTKSNIIQPKKCFSYHKVLLNTTTRPNIVHHTTITEKTTESNTVHHTTITEKKTFEPDLSDILKLYIADFNQKQHLPFVVKESIPIVWFGDITAYFNSDFKIVTVGLNPSEQEFMCKSNCNNMIMLPNHEKRFDMIDFTKLSSDEQVEKLKTNLNKYFNKNPYRWFNKYNKLLEAKNCSYYKGKKNTAIHIDLFTAIATTPTWGKLNDKQKSQIENKKLFLNLLEILNPDLVLSSVNTKTFEEVFKNYERIKEHKFDGNNYIRTYKMLGSDRIVLNGTNMQGTPFGGIKETFSKIIIKSPDAKCENCRDYISKHCGGIKLCEKYELNV